jgi:iron complex outermembrane receptor protein/hemoglobin/transferrin/lactoferrin receptor protein
VSRRAAAALACVLALTPGATSTLAAQVPSDTAARDSAGTILPTLVVTGTRAELGGAAAPLPASELGGDRLRAETSVSIARALERLPGLRTLSTGEQVGKPVIRGLSGPRVLVLDNGLRLEDQSWSDEDGPSVDARLADRIEVIRGPASVLYGSDAIAGVVNVLPAPVPRAEPGERLGGVHTEIHGGSNNAEAGLLVGAAGASGRTGGRLTLIGRRAADLHTPGGELPNTGFSALDGEAAAALHGSTGSTTLRYTHSGGEFKLLEAGGPGAVDNPEAEEGGPERKLSDDRIQVAADYGLARARVEARAQWQRHWIAEQSDEAPAPGRVFDLALTTWTAEVLVHHTLGARIGSTVGLSGAYQRNDTRGPVPLVPDATVRGAGVFALERVDLGRWALLAGVRADVRGVRPDGVTPGLTATARDFHNVTADLGAVFRPAAEVALTANAGRAWRSPNLLELFADGPRLGEARFERGDPALDAETSFNLDLGIRWERGPVEAQLAVYRNRIDRYIFGAPTAEFEDSLRVFRYAQTDATLVGFEGQARADLSARLTVGGRVDYTRGTDTRSDQPLPLIPPVRGVLEAEVHSLDFGWLAEGRVGAEVELVGHQGRLGAYVIEGAGVTVIDVPTDGYALLGLDAAGSRLIGDRRLSVSIRVRNLLNTKYRDYLSRYKELAFNPGRNVVLRIGLDL